MIDRLCYLIYRRALRHESRHEIAATGTVAANPTVELLETWWRTPFWARGRAK